MEDKQININDQIMDKISHGKVKMRPHWQFLAEKIGLESGILLSLVLAVFAASLLLYYWKVNELPRLTSLGLPGIWQILINFPYELIAAICLLLLLLAYIIRKMDWGYQHSWVIWVGAALALILLGSSAALAFNLNEQLEGAVNKNNLPIANSFYQKRIHNISNGVVNGMIESIKNNELKIVEYLPGEASDTQTLTIKKSEVKIEPKQNKLSDGDRVKLLGNVENGIFKPWGLLEVESRIEEKEIKGKAVSNQHGQSERLEKLKQD